MKLLLIIKVSWGLATYYVYKIYKGMERVYHFRKLYTEAPSANKSTVRVTKHTEVIPFKGLLEW